MALGWGPGDSWCQESGENQYRASKGPAVSCWVFLTALSGSTLSQGHIADMHFAFSFQDFIFRQLLNLSGQCPDPFLQQVMSKEITSEILGTNDGGLRISFLLLPHL